MSDTPRVAEALRALEERRRLAMLAADTAALRDILDEGLVYVHSTGTRDSRASYLGKLDDGAVRYEELSTEVVEIAVRERFALLRGTMTARVRTPDRTLVVASHYEVVWMRAAQAWRVVAFQGFPPDTASRST